MPGFCDRYKGRRAGGSLLAVALAAATIVAQNGSAEAAPQPVTAPVTGSFATLAGSISLTGTVFQGTWDAATGGLEGRFAFPATTLEWTSYNAILGVQLEQPAVGSGSVNLTTRQAAFDATLVLAVSTLESGGSTTGNLTSCSYSYPAQLTGSYTSGVLNLEDVDLTGEAVPAADRCLLDYIGLSIAPVLDPEMAGPGNHLDASFRLATLGIDPIYAGDVHRAGRRLQSWRHFGSSAEGVVSAESWVDVHWPCFSATDEDDDCMVEDVRGHGLVEKVHRVKRTQIDFVRLGRHPSGILAFNGTNVNSGTRPLIESRTPWVSLDQFCGAASLRAWTRVTFDVRWSDDYLTKGLSLLSGPTSEYSASICAAGFSAASPTERQLIRGQMLGE